MLKRLFLVLQYLSLIPPVITFIFWMSSGYTPFSSTVFIFVVSVIPFVLILLIKYIIYGKFYIFKDNGIQIEEGGE